MKPQDRIARLREWCVQDEYLNDRDELWLLDVAEAALRARRGFDAVDSMECNPPDLGDDYLDAMYTLRDVLDGT